MTGFSANVSAQNSFPLNYPGFTGSSGSSSGRSTTATNVTANTSLTTLNWQNAGLYNVTVTTATTISFTNLPASGQYSEMPVYITQPSPSVNITLPSALWSYGVSPSLTVSNTGASEHDLLFSTSNGAALRGYYVGPYMQ